MQDSADGHKFNDDLLADDGDRDTVRQLFPTLEHVLYHEQLVDYFKKCNDKADAAKRKSRTWGKRAIILGAAPLMLAAGEILLETWTPGHWTLAIGAIAAISGILSVAIGAFNILLGSRKREWLHNRFMGERIRQFHFQSLIAQLPEILDSSREGASEEKKRFEADRHQSFIRFQSEFDGKVDGKFSSVIGPSGENDFWLHRLSDKSFVSDCPSELGQLFSAYRLLRIEHQLGFANNKLTNDHRILSDLP
jgi:hypothetical protein